MRGHHFSFKYNPINRILLHEPASVRVILAGAVLIEAEGVVPFTGRVQKGLRCGFRHDGGAAIAVIVVEVRQIVTPSYSAQSSDGRYDR